MEDVGDKKVFSTVYDGNIHLSVFLEILPPPPLGGFVYDLLAPDLLLGLMNLRLLLQRPHEVRRIYFVNYNLPSIREWRFGRRVRETDKSS